MYRYACYMFCTTHVRIYTDTIPRILQHTCIIECYNNIVSFGIHGRARVIAGPRGRRRGYYNITKRAHVSEINYRKNNNKIRYRNGVFYTILRWFRHNNNQPCYSWAFRHSRAGKTVFFVFFVYCFFPPPVLNVVFRPLRYRDRLTYYFSPPTLLPSPLKLQTATNGLHDHIPLLLYNRYMLTLRIKYFSQIQC